MLLAIDIGNTNTVVGVFDSAELRESFRVTSEQHVTVDEAGFLVSGLVERMGIDSDAIDTVVIASVVPPLTPVFERMAQEYFDCQPVMVTATTSMPITLDVDHPTQVGADRIANAVAAYHLFGGPSIVVDFGTAINFDVVNPDGAYVGGVLMPGPTTSMAELARKAAKLFEVKIEKPHAVVGRSTEGALKSGLYYGTLGQVDFVLEKILAETGFEGTTIVGTGGLARGIEEESRFIKRVEPTLTLQGLRIIGSFQ